MVKRKPAVFISGPITGIDNYRDIFAGAEVMLEAEGYIALNPAKHPQGLTNKQYARMCMAQIDCADAVFLLKGWRQSDGAKLEWFYCRYIDKPCAESLEALRVVTGKERDHDNT